MSIVWNRAEQGAVFAEWWLPGDPRLVPTLPWCCSGWEVALVGCHPLLLRILKSVLFQTVTLFPVTFGLIRNWHQAKEGRVTECLLSTRSVHFRQSLIVMAADIY